MTWHQYNQFESSNISKVRYDADTSTLEVTFKSGGVYQYFDVPMHVSQAFEQADSKGKYLASHIKGVFRFSKV